jgi:hypothetical protein
MRRIATALLLISGFYTDAQLYAARHALAQDGERRVVDYLQDGWVIKAAIAGPPRVLVLQKDSNAKWCEMRDTPSPVTIKGVPQLFTASCSAVR